MYIAHLVAVCVLGVVLGYIVDRAVVRSLKTLLDGLVRRGAATAFFQQALRTCIALAVLGSALGHNWDTSGPGMQQVWAIGSTLGEIMGWLVAIILTFAVLGTILVATLGRRPTEPPVCLKCGYDLRSQIGELRCPECGEPYAGRE